MIAVGTSPSVSMPASPTGMFTGALLTVGRLELLVVIVSPAVLADEQECQLTIRAYHARFLKPVVLMAQDQRSGPRYYGPTRLVPVLAVLPFELIPWRQFLYRAPTPWRLPIPPDPPPSSSSSSFASASVGATAAPWRTVSPTSPADGKPRGTPPSGVTVRKRRPGMTLPLPPPPAPLDEEPDTVDTSENRTIPLERVDLEEVPRWS